LRDYDYHPYESDVRVFTITPASVLRADDILVYHALYDQAVLWHYAFCDRWYKINVTTDLDGNLVETAPSARDGLTELVDLIERRKLLGLLDDAFSFGDTTFLPRGRSSGFHFLRHRSCSQESDGRGPQDRLGEHRPSGDG
jgi:hypothetical protein